MNMMNMKLDAVVSDTSTQRSPTSVFQLDCQSELSSTMKVVLLLALLSVAECGRVVGHTGHRVTLPCRYDIKKHGPLSACWSRGELPFSGCNNPLIATDGSQVREGTRVSSRYQLLGRLDEGDVSLTIQNLRDEDAGRYGCRLEIPGLFNDEKHHFDLTVRAPPTTTSSTSDTETMTTNQAAGTLNHVDTSEAGHMTSSETLLTSSSPTTEPAEQGSMVTVILVCLLFLFVLLVTAVGLLIIARRWKQLKVPQQQLVQSRSTLTNLQLQQRHSAPENIYEIDSGDYEFSP